LAHTVVCKGTYQLDAGEASLAPDQELLTQVDAHWNDDPRKSLRLASDWAPFKRRADVVLVGSAFAPGSTQVRRLVSCMAVGPMEKALEVRCDRWVGMDEELQEGPPFARMPLVWERSGGGADTNNPAGRAPLRDAFGKIQLPNVQPVAFDPSGPDWEVQPVGFGPIAPTWPTRAHALGAHARTGIDALLETGLPEDFDYSYFQIAPRDQQLDRFSTDAQVLLENLVGGIDRLVTRLPGHRARAILEPSGREIELIPDTVWIDTDHLQLTITWRGTVWVSEHPTASRVLIAVEPRDAQFTPEQIRDLGGGGEETMSLRMADEPSHPGLPFGAPRSTEPRKSHDAYVGTPFGPSAATSAAAKAFSTPLRRYETAELPAISDDMSTSDLIREHIGLATNGANAPSTPPNVPVASGSQPGVRMSFGQPLSSAAAAPPAAVPPPRAVPPAAVPPAAVPPAAALPGMVPPPPVGSHGGVANPSLSSSGLPAMHSPATTSPIATPQPPPFNTAALAASAAPPSYLKDAKGAAPPATVVGHAANAALAGVAGASDAAAAQRVQQRQVAGPAPRERRTGSFVDLLWFLPTLPERLHTSTDWAKLMRGATKGAEWLTAKGGGEARAKDDPPRDVARALARGTPLDANGVTKAVEEAVDEDGFLVRPMVVVEGDVSMALDPLVALETALSLSEPLSATDKRFKETHDSSSELVKSNRKVTAPMLEAARERLRQAFVTAGSKAYPANYLETTTDRILIDERKFLKKTVLGDARLVATITPNGSGTPIPIYLPAELENVVPALAKFRARVLAEPHAKQEAGEGDPTTLLVLAFGRVMGR